MVSVTTPGRLPQTQTFTVQDLLAMQVHRPIQEPSISYAKRALLKRKLRSEYTAAGDVRRGVQQVVQEVLNLVNTIVFAPASSIAWLEHTMSGPGADIAYGRKRIARLRPSAGIKNLRKTFRNAQESTQCP